MKCRKDPSRECQIAKFLRKKKNCDICTFCTDRNDDNDPPQLLAFDDFEGVPA